MLPARQDEGGGMETVLGLHAQVQRAEAVVAPMEDTQLAQHRTDVELLQILREIQPPA